LRETNTLAQQDKWSKRPRIPVKSPSCTTNFLERLKNEGPKVPKLQREVFATATTPTPKRAVCYRYH
jgi:hypothetical protein